jgi:FAD/FMN-containing dehydrogenase
MPVGVTALWLQQPAYTSRVIVFRGRGTHQLEQQMTVLMPGDPEYDTARATFNAMVDRRPARIVRCFSATDVVVAVRDARESGLPISVRGGGHSVAGQCMGEGAVAIDLGGLRHVDVDVVARTAVAGGGATWADYDSATQAFGLASTGGTFVDTGISGLTLGGGIGYLQGTQGFAVDTLIGVRLVSAGGEILRASTEENGDLFWAIRGAGANFGVVTDLEYRLEPITQLYGGMIVYPMSAAAEVLRITRDLADAAPDNLTLQYVLGTRTAATVVLACFQGSEREGEKLLAPLRKLRPVQVDALRVLTYSEMQATNPLLPFGLRHYWKGHFLSQLPDNLVDLLVDRVMGRPTTGFSTLLIEFINGVPLRVPADAMAFNQRTAHVNASALGIWLSPADDDGHVSWARDLAATIAPHSTGAEYVNYMADDAPADRVRAAYGDAKYARLRQLKTQYDPDNVFRFNQNIPPAA